MKILFVTDLYPIGEENIAKTLFYFVQEWQKLGHNVDVIRSNFILNTLIRGRTIIKEDIYNEYGTKIYNLNFHTPFLFNVYNKLPKDFSLKNYDVIISHMPCGALMATKLLEKERIKYICATHCSDIKILTGIKYIMFRKKLENAYKIANKIAARSPILKNKINSLLPVTKEKTFVAFSGINEELINNETKNIDKNNIKITTVASLIKRKNIDIIIKSISLLKEKNIHLTIIGDGKEKKALQTLTHKLNLENKITFKGNIKREDVFKELKKSDIFVLLSQNETFGLSYLEAMATGNIVIAKKNDGIDGIIKDKENGFLIDSKPENLKLCIEEILNLNEEEINKLKINSFNTIKNYTNKIASENYIENLS